MSDIGAKHGRATESGEEATEEANGAGPCCVSALGGAREFAASGGGGGTAEFCSGLDIFSVGPLGLDEEIFAASSGG
jgi:hypothetical protein